MNHFEPAQARGQSLRRTMDASLWESVRSVLSLPPGPAHSELRAHPSDYAAYSDLVLDDPRGGSFASEIRDKAANALSQRLAGGLQSDDRRDGLPRIAAFDFASYSQDEISRMNRWWDTEDFNPMGLAPISDEDCRIARERLLEAIAVMREADPELLGEILAIVDEIVLTRPDGSQRFDYSAGSSFALWGGVLFNVDQHPAWPRYYKNLTHEAGHSLLFAIGREGGFVCNEPGESHASPVRDDPRPVDGIFHAAFVAARESRAFHRLLEWNDTANRLSEAELNSIEAILDESVITFWQCSEALEANALLTQLGQAVLQDCTDYMTAHFELLTD